MLCDFHKNVCCFCGRVNKSGVSDLKANCRRRCAHLGAAKTEVKVECDTCRGKVLVSQPAHACAALGRCLPTYSPADLAKWQARKPESDIYHLCRGCDRFEALPPAPGGE